MNHKQDNLENKEVVRSLRLSNEEYHILKNGAQNAGLCVSDYIRIKLFDMPHSDDNETNNSSKSSLYDKEHGLLLMQLMVGTCALVEKMAKKTLDERELASLKKETTEFLKKKGYLKKNELNEEE